MKWEQLVISWFFFLLAYLAFEPGSWVEVLEERTDGSKQIPFLTHKFSKCILINRCGKSLTILVHFVFSSGYGRLRLEKKIPSNICLPLYITKNKIFCLTCPPGGWLRRPGRDDMNPFFQVFCSLCYFGWMLSREMLHRWYIALGLLR